MCFSRDGKRLVSASLDKTVKVWDVRGGREHLALEGQSYAIAGVCFSPDGRRVLGKSTSNTVMAWDAATGTRLPKGVDPESFSPRGAISPGGNNLACPAYPTSNKIYVIDMGPLSDEELRYRQIATRLDPYWQFEQAFRHEKEKNWHAAAFHWSWVVHSDPAVLEHWQRLDHACRQLRSWHHAQEVCTRLAKEQPNLDLKLHGEGGSPWLNFLVARAHHRIGNKTKAKEYFNLARLPGTLNADERKIFEALPRETAFELGLEKPTPVLIPPSPVAPNIEYVFGEQMQIGLTVNGGKKIVYDDKGETNSTLVRADGKDFIFGSAQGRWQSKLAPLDKGPDGKERRGNRSIWILGKIAVTQIVEIVPSSTEKLDTCLVRYEIENNDDLPHEVGLRIFDRHVHRRQ